MNREDDKLRALIRGEIESSSVRAAIETISPKRPWYSGLMRHPIALTIFGFLLTTLVGTFISHEVSERANRDKQRSEALEAVRSFTTEASALRVSQSFLLSSFRRNAPLDELSIRKEAYDQAFASWFSKLHANALFVREFFGFTYPNFAEQALQRSLNVDFQKMDVCLTEAFDMKKTSSKIDEELDLLGHVNSCLAESGRVGSDEESPLEVTRDRQSSCSLMIFDMLNHYIAKDLNCRSKSWASGAPNSNVAKAYDSIMMACAAGNEKQSDLQRYEGDFSTFCTAREPTWYDSLIPGR